MAAFMDVNFYLMCLILTNCIRKGYDKSEKLGKFLMNTCFPFCIICLFPPRNMEIHLLAAVDILNQVVAYAVIHLELFCVLDKNKYRSIYR